MKKLFLAGILAATATFGANATIVTFDDSSFGGSGVEFDIIDFRAGDMGTVTQQFDGNLATPDAFNEFGDTKAVNFQIGNTTVVPVSPYEMFFDYNLSGDASFAPTAFGGLINVLFSTGTAALKVDTTIDNAISGGATTVANFNLLGGSFCSLTVVASTEVGVCNINLAFAPVSGYFSIGGVDLVDLIAAGAQSFARLIVTVQDISGVNFASNPTGEQQFQIQHDGNLIVDIPEPASLAVFGLGLIGLAGLRRRRA